MKAALIPITTTHNPDVEPVLAGFCIHHRDRGWWWSRHGWVKERASAMVYETLGSARYAANMLGGAVVTPRPRFNGHCVEWVEVPA